MENRQLDILQTTNMMFRAAAGGQYLSEFMILVNNLGNSVEALARLLAQTEVFQQRYPDTLSNAAFSIQFVDNSVGDQVAEVHKAWAAGEIERWLNAGMGRGEVMYWAAKVLAAVNENDPDWGAAARQFNHFVEVSGFYSIDKAGPATGVAVLQRVPALVEELASVDRAKTVLASSVTGSVIDGYVKGATVFADLNADQQLNNVECSTVTDATGHFTLPAIIGFGELIVSGGIDIATGKPFKGMMTAPAGASVITPFTTLISHIVKNDDVAADEAADLVLNALGLDGSIDLLHYDPIQAVMRADSLSTTTSAMTAHAAAAMINVMTNQVAALLQGAGVTDIETSAISLAYQALAGLLAGERDGVDLTDRSVISQVIQDATLLAGADRAESCRIGALLTDASGTIGNLTQAINTLSISGETKKTILINIAALQIVAEDLEAAMQSGAAQGNVSSTTTDTTGSQFTKNIAAAAAKVGDVDGDGKPDALSPPSSSGGGSGGGGGTSTLTHYLTTNATAFSGTAANDILSISTAAAWTPLIMTPWYSTAVLGITRSACRMARILPPPPSAIFRI